MTKQNLRIRVNDMWTKFEHKFQGCFKQYVLSPSYEQDIIRTLAIEDENDDSPQLCEPNEDDYVDVVHANEDEREYVSKADEFLHSNDEEEDDFNSETSIDDKSEYEKKHRLSTDLSILKARLACNEHEKSRLASELNKLKNNSNYRADCGFREDEHAMKKLIVTCVIVSVVVSFCFVKLIG
uniref:Uncharacterized protein n=1 Tax=Chenopodium quinoa TaxID=63459 RepID=A0A803LVZ3_CHEQI